MRRLWGWIAFAVLLALAAPARPADELVEAAKKEKARQEALKKKRAAKKPEGVMTNDSLRHATADSRGVSEVTPHHEAVASSGGETAPAGGTEAAAAAKPGEEAAPAEGGAKKKDEAYWRGRMSEAQGVVSKAEKELADLDQRINQLRRDVTAISDPIVTTRLQQERIAAEAEWPKAQQRVADAKKGIDQLRQEARREGAPAGWLR